MDKKKYQCPFCEQGEIVQASVKIDGRKIYICEECDTVWPDRIGKDNATNFDDFMRQYGISLASWEQIEIIS